MTPTRRRSKPLPTSGRNRPSSKRRSYVRVDLAAILSIDHVCKGCVRPETCCCGKYEVCVDATEISEIIQVFPEVVKLCPHLRTANGYDNVFEEVEPGLYAIDTTEDGLCVFAFASGHRIRCSLHAVAATLGLPLGKVKPKACILWPLSFAEGDEVLSVDDEALSFRCTSLRQSPSRRLPPSLGRAIELIYGEIFRAQLEEEASRGAQRAVLPRHC